MPTGGDAHDSQREHWEDAKNLLSKSPGVVVGYEHSTPSNTLLHKRLTLRGFIIFQDIGHLCPAFANAMGDWLAAGQMQSREDMSDGLDRRVGAGPGRRHRPVAR